MHHGEARLVDVLVQLRAMYVTATGTSHPWLDQLVSLAARQTRIDLEEAVRSEQADVDAVMALPKSMWASAPDAVAANVTGLADAHAAAPQSGTDAADDPASGVNSLRFIQLVPVTGL